MTDQTNQEEATKNIEFENLFLLKIQEEATSNYETVVTNYISNFLTNTYEVEYFVNYKPFFFSVSKENQAEIYGLQFALETMMEKNIIYLEYEDESMSKYSIRISNNKESQKKIFNSHNEIMDFLAKSTIWSPVTSENIVEEENTENTDETVIVDTQEAIVE